MKITVYSVLGVVVWAVVIFSVAAFLDAPPRSTFMQEGSLAYDIVLDPGDADSPPKNQRHVCLENGMESKGVLDRGTRAIFSHDGSGSPHYISRKIQLLGPRGVFDFHEHVILRCITTTPKHIWVRIYKRAEGVWQVERIIPIEPCANGWYYITFGAPHTASTFIPVTTSTNLPEDTR